LELGSGARDRVLAQRRVARAACGALAAGAVARRGAGVRGGAVLNDGELLRDRRSESPWFAGARAAAARIWRIGLGRLRAPRLVASPQAGRVPSPAPASALSTDTVQKVLSCKRGVHASAVRRGPWPGRARAQRGFQSARPRTACPARLSRPRPRRGRPACRSARGAPARALPERPTRIYATPSERAHPEAGQYGRQYSFLTTK
jgi:hypothetical protein